MIFCAHGLHTAAVRPAMPPLWSLGERADGRPDAGRFQQNPGSSCRGRKNRTVCCGKKKAPRSEVACGAVISIRKKSPRQSIRSGRDSTRFYQSGRSTGKRNAEKNTPAVFTGGGLEIPHNEVPWLTKVCRV